MGGYTFVVMGIVLLVLSFLGGLLGDIATLIVTAGRRFGRQRVDLFVFVSAVYIGKMK